MAMEQANALEVPGFIGSSTVRIMLGTWRHWRFESMTISLQRGYSEPLYYSFKPYNPHPFVVGSIIKISNLMSWSLLSFLGLWQRDTVLFMNIYVVYR